MRRNVTAVLLAASGLGLLGLAALDWTRYTAFAVSLVWR